MISGRKAVGFQKSVHAPDVRKQTRDGQGMIGSRDTASALPDLPPAGGSAGVARALVGVQGRRVAGASPRGGRVAQRQPETSAADALARVVPQADLAAGDP